jgi:hypothetical protein
MASFNEIVKAEMALMEGKRLIMGSSYPGDSIIEICEEGVKRLQEFIEQVKKNPEEYKVKESDGKHPCCQLRIELVEFLGSYFKDLGME